MSLSCNCKHLLCLSLLSHTELVVFPVFPTSFQMICSGIFLAQPRNRLRNSDVMEMGRSDFFGKMSPQFLANLKIINLL